MKDWWTTLNWRDQVDTTWTHWSILAPLKVGQPENMCFLVKGSKKYIAHLWSSPRKYHHIMTHHTNLDLYPIKSLYLTPNFKKIRWREEQDKGHSEEEIRSKSKIWNIIQTREYVNLIRILLQTSNSKKTFLRQSWRTKYELSVKY